MPAPHDLLLDEKTYLTNVLFAAIALLEYDLEFLTYDPETIILEVEGELPLKMPLDNRAKLLAAVAVLTTDGVYTDLEKFAQFASLAYERDSSPMLELPDLFACVHARVEMTLLDPPQKEELQPRENPQMAKSWRKKEAEMEFSEEIRAYVGVTAVQEGLSKPPLWFPEAIVEPPVVDDPNWYSALHRRNDEISEELDEYVSELLEAIKAQGRDLKTADGRPLYSDPEGEED